jgi:hypothetical protein
MKIRDAELLARLRALGSKVRGGTPTPSTAGPAAAGVDDAVNLLGLPEQELTPSVRVALRDLIEEVAGFAPGAGLDPEPDCRAGASCG